MKFQRLARLTLAAVLALAVSSTGCALAQKFGNVRHQATVTVASAHAVLSSLQDGEALLVCNRMGAPAPPACVSGDAHQQISAKLATAFDLEVKVARLVRDAGTATPADVPKLVEQISALVDQVLSLIPKSAQKEQLVATTAAAGGVR